MDIKSLTTLAIENPNGEGSTARFLLKDGTLWIKHYKGFRPMISYRCDHTIEWPEVGGLATRTRRMMDSILYDVKLGWREKVATLAGEENPHVTIRVTDFNLIDKEGGSQSYLGLDKKLIRKGTTKIIAMGVDPSGDTEGRDPDIRTGFQETLENVLVSLAYGAVDRENKLTGLSKTLVQQRNALDTLVASAEAEMATRRETYFAPSADEEACVGDYLSNSMALVNNVASKCGDLQSLCGQFNRLATSPESVTLEESCGNPDDHPNQVRGEWRGDDGLFMAGANANTIMSASYRQITMVDRNSKTYSYYWFREHFEFYRGVLRQMGCVVNPLFGLHPHEWDYTNLASIVYAAKGGE